MMTAIERRDAILDRLCVRRHDQVKNLAEEFGVSEKTIRTDIEVLACSYQIETVRGRHGGGIYVADGYHRGRKTLSPEQAALRKKLAPSLEGHDLEVMNSIINQFASYYEGVGESKKWMRIETYGPKLVENIVQATARDLLALAMLRLRDAGFDIVMHIHDEAVLEVPEGVSSVDEVCRIMAVAPDWAAGLPLRADGYECPFYKKD